jgi:hypothetical protein
MAVAVLFVSDDLGTMEPALLYLLSYCCFIGSGKNAVDGAKNVAF